MAKAKKARPAKRKAKAGGAGALAGAAAAVPSDGDQAMAAIFRGLREDSVEILTQAERMCEGLGGSLWSMQVDLTDGQSGMPYDILMLALLRKAEAALPWLLERAQGSNNAQAAVRLAAFNSFCLLRIGSCSDDPLESRMVSESAESMLTWLHDGKGDEYFAELRLSIGRRLHPDAVAIMDKVSARFRSGVEAAALDEAAGPGKDGGTQGRGGSKQL